jgi:MGT family glycosyltransferase
MRVLLAAPPLFGHVGPLAAVGAELRSRGHDVVLLTGEGYESLATRSGLGFRGLPTDPAGTSSRRSPRRGRRRARVVEGREQVLETFVRPMPAQHRAVTRLLRESRWDIVLCDASFLGLLPTLLGHGDRPAVLAVSTTPLSLVSVDVAPFGAAMQPGRSAFSRMRNQQIRWLLMHGPWRPVQRELEQVLVQCGVSSASVDYFDHAAWFDGTFHLAPAEFEYPRRELPSTVHFVGPLPLDPPTPQTLPDWWDDLDDEVVVHVTQGTLDNEDLGKLIAPTVRALAGLPVLTVVTTGGRPTAAVREAVGGRLPANARVAEFLPYAALLPRTSVVVSNGGYGGVQESLRHGVPLVVAGDSEDKPEVAARVRRVGAGVDLRTGTPSRRQIRRAVARVLGDPSYAWNAARMRRSIVALGDPRDRIADAVEQVARDGWTPPHDGREARTG